MNKHFNVYDKMLFDENGILNGYTGGSYKNDFTSESIVTPGIYYPPNRHRFRKKTSRNKHERAVLKNGEINVSKFSIYDNFRIISHWFVIMVDARWRWTLINFFVAFTSNWLFFGFIYWIICMIHGDLTFEYLPPFQNETQWKPCVKNIYGFTSTFLFSIEVHTTVAYGKRSITLECPQAIIAMCLQCIVSTIFQSFMVGILFAKITRPKSRTQTILFNKNAVIYVRDDNLCLVFRVGDMRKSRILNIKALVYIVKLETDNEVLDNFEQIELSTELDGCESTFFLWPVSVIHVIDENSPLYRLSAADLLCGKLEILVVFEGTIESTGQPVQARSSFTENEILWGHRFVSLVVYDEERKTYNVDFSKLSESEQVDTPLCSASEYQTVVSCMYASGV